MVFAFDRQPNMPCSHEDTCTDFVEIRATSDPTFDAVKFCSCGQSSGRVVKTDLGQAAIHFNTFSGQSKSGFRLHVYSTCSGTSAASLTEECIITDTGYDYEGSKTRTDSGASCNAWSGQSALDAFSFPDSSLGEAGSKCRNPNSRASAWCYIGGNYRNTGDCSFPECRKSISNNSSYLFIYFFF